MWGKFGRQRDPRLLSIGQVSLHQKCTYCDVQSNSRGDRMTPPNRVEPSYMFIVRVH